MQGWNSIHEIMAPKNTTLQLLSFKLPAYSYLEFVMLMCWLWNSPRFDLTLRLSHAFMRSKILLSKQLLCTAVQTALNKLLSLSSRNVATCFGDPSRQDHDDMSRSLKQNENQKCKNQKFKIRKSKSSKMGVWKLENKNWERTHRKI